MKLIFLGSGSAFVVGRENYQSNMILEAPDGQRLLIDCGSDARHSLYDQGLTYKDIQDVYISHLHADHVGGLEWLAFKTKFDDSCQRIRLHLSEQLVQPLWERVLSGGLCCLEGQCPLHLSTFFEVHPIPSNGHFMWHQVKCEIIQTIHTVCGYAIMPSFGLLLDVKGLSVFITTDTQLAPHQIQDIYRKAHLIFQDCETSAYKSGVHAHYQELLNLDPEIKKKMWLYHYSEGALPDAKKDGFQGFVRKGQLFNLSLET